MQTACQSAEPCASWCCNRLSRQEVVAVSGEKRAEEGERKRLNGPFRSPTGAERTVPAQERRDQQDLEASLRGIVLIYPPDGVLYTH